MHSAKKGFSLVEMIVVIGIIAVLTAVILGVTGSSGESAEAAKCLANMKNLANACYSSALNGSFRKLPNARSSEKAKVDTKEGVRNIKINYLEEPGWISWDSRDKYPAQSSQKGSINEVSLYSDEYEQYTHALTNGAIWRYVSASAKSYVCPRHVKKNAKARWSYLMNSYVGGRRIDNLPKPADRLLLFAEVPFQGSAEWMPDDGGSESDTDAILEDDGKLEHIGCNHKSGKYWMAHLVFVDGHVEKLRAPADTSNLKELTKWLCHGISVGANGSNYQNLD